MTPVVVATSQVPVPTSDAMVELGRALAGLVTAGDLLVLSGALGAGKTTLTRGLGEALGVRGAVTSPTFVIARLHPPLPGGTGPALLHVDAYRLGTFAELDDLDLDTAVEDCVTVVEWGQGLAEPLTDHRLEVVVDRATAATDLLDGDDDARTVTLRALGERWRGVTLPGAD